MTTNDGAALKQKLDVGLYSFTLRNVSFTGDSQGMAWIQEHFDGLVKQAGKRGLQVDLETTVGLPKNQPTKVLDNVTLRTVTDIEDTAQEEIKDAVVEIPKQRGRPPKGGVTRKGAYVPTGRPRGRPKKVV